MNRLFKVGVWYDRTIQKHRVEKLLHPIGAQATMYQELLQQE